MWGNKRDSTPEWLFVTDVYLANVVSSAQDYSPFGMALVGRTYSSGNYRYGFNGKEKDSDIGEGDYDYGMRIHDARLGRFLSVDPMANSFSMLTPYQYASNRPIDGIDMDGLEYATYHTRIDFGLSGYPGKITSSYYVWNNANQHNSYGNLGPGILYQTDFYYNGKKMEPGVSRNEFVPRNEWVAGGLIQGDYGNYMGSTSLHPVSPFSLENPMFTSDYAYDIAPVDFVDFRALKHDLGYDKLFAVGASSLTQDFGTTPVDLTAYTNWNNFLQTSMVGMPDPYNKQPITGTEINAAARAKTLFFGVLAYKFSAISSFMTENYSDEVQKPDTDGALKFNYNLFLGKYMEKDTEGDWRRKSGMWNVDENNNYTPKKSSEIKQE